MKLIPRVKPSWRPWRNLLLALVGVSLFQYTTSGEVSWPTTVAEKIGSMLRPHASGLQARATHKLEEMGAAREGQPTPAFGITGRVVRVADGDTVSVLDGSNTQHKIRLQGIDAPERSQPYGKKSRDALSGMVSGRNVGVVVLGKDSYGRSNGTVYLGERNINLAMVAAGHAWWYRYYAPDNHLLEAAEGKARAAKLGLWAEPNPVPPWDWRRQQKYSKP
ncbi:MAG: thermonuclease family protein [Halioglobus sp.]|nr:thermonuclease family protein [Halioglobus sp.]